jgi:hypothetical protein
MIHDDNSACFHRHAVVTLHRMSARYGIGEIYGRDFARLATTEMRQLASNAFAPAQINLMLNKTFDLC